MTAFQPTSDQDLAKAMLFNRSRLTENGCWEWTAGLGSGGYGLFYYKNQNQRAHRVSYQIYTGEIPAGMVICHSCDNPRCINPDHLRAGTMKDNALDREARGRRDVKGEQIGTSKLTEADVMAIKARPDLGPTALGAMYGVGPNQVWLIRTGRSWKHLNTATGL